MIIKIGIIGMGAVGTSLLVHLIEELGKNKTCSRIEIHLFERSDELATGLAYQADDITNILNRPADKMSVRFNFEKDFEVWVSQNIIKIKNAYPDVDIEEQYPYLPRAIFGLYLKDTLDKTINHASKIGIHVKIIREEVIDIKSRGKIFDILTQQQKLMGFNYVVLTIGHTTCQKFQHLKNISGFINNPYPTKNLIKSISHKDASVGILGSRLSAIDAAIALTENGHTGKIYFISRNGLLPAIRSDYTKELSSFYHPHPREMRSLFSIKKFLESVVSHNNGKKAFFNEWLKRPKDPISFLRYEFTQSEKNLRAIWDTILFESNHIIERLWHHLPHKGKKWFLKKFRSQWLSYRVGIPRKNALKILKLLESGQLCLVEIDGKPTYDASRQKFVISSKSCSLIETDYLINASGSPIMIEEMHSPLIDNLLRSGIITAHEFGGIKIDFETSNVMDFKQQFIENLFAIGQITAGTYFFTSVLALNVKHAYEVAQQIVTQIEMLSQNICKVGNL